MRSVYDINHLVQEAQRRWLKPAEVYFILENHESFQITEKAPQKPNSGSLFLFNKNVLRFFRKDGHNWRKKKDGKSVGEAHERLKVNNVEALNCYYAHGEDNPNFQRRSYWILDPAHEHIVLVHYREITVQGNSNAGSILDFSPSPSYTISQTVNNIAIQNQGTSSLSDLHGSNQSLSSPGPGEVSSQAAAQKQMMDHPHLELIKDFRTSPKIEVSQALRRIEEQLSLDDDSFTGLAPFDDQKQVVGGPPVFGFDEGTNMQQNVCYSEDDVTASSLNDLAALQEIGSLLFPRENENFKSPAYSEITAAATNILGYHSTQLVPGQIQMPLESDSCLTRAPEHKFKIKEILADWGFANESTKVIIIGSFTCNPSDGSWSCMFGNTEVPVEIIQDGVLCCQAPPNCPGKVTVCITRGNREACSEVKEFEYRDKNSSCSNCSEPRQQEDRNIELSLLVKFVQMLLSESSVQTGDATGLNFDPSRVEKGSEDSRGNIFQAHPMESEDSSGTIDWVLQQLLKDKLHQWLSAKFMERDDILGCPLTKKEQGIIHLVAGLGYEWALNPILDSGVGVNFRDINGWTALHWAARFGREKMVAALIARGASAGAVTDPTEKDPVGKTPASIASERDHNGLAGYLSELSLTSHLSSLTLEEAELSKQGVNVEAQVTLSDISRSIATSPEDQHSMKQTLEAVRNATQAAACIQSAFRAHSFRKRQEKEALDEIQGLSVASKLYNHNSAALSIQKSYRGWKGRKDFLTMRQKAVKIQAHIRGYQVRKKYKVICWAVGILDKVVLRWRRKGAGLRGFKPGGESMDEDEDYEDMLKVFRKKKVDEAISEAVSRVLSMIHSPEARHQYARMLDKFQEAKVQLGILTNEEAWTLQADVLAMDNNDDLFELP